MANVLLMYCSIKSFIEYTINRATKGAVEKPGVTNYVSLQNYYVLNKDVNVYLIVSAVQRYMFGKRIKMQLYY